MKQFLTVNFKWFIIAGIAIALLLMWKGCGDGKAEKALADLAILQHEKDSVLVEKNALINLYNNNLLRLAGDRDSIQLIADNRKQQLATVKPRVIRLAGEVLIKTDSLKCDSLANFANDLIWLIDDYVNQQTITQLKTDSIETDLRGTIKAQDEKIQVLTKTLDFATNTVIPTIKKKSEVYVGGDIIGSKTTIFSGYGANANLLTKKGQIYSVGANWINGEAFYSAGIKVRLSFRKH